MRRLPLPARKSGFPKDAPNVDEIKNSSVEHVHPENQLQAESLVNEPVEPHTSQWLSDFQRTLQFQQPFTDRRTNNNDPDASSAAQEASESHNSTAASNRGTTGLLQQRSRYSVEDSGGNYSFCFDSVISFSSYRRHRG